MCLIVSFGKRCFSKIMKTPPGVLLLVPFILADDSAAPPPAVAAAEARLDDKRRAKSNDVKVTETRHIADNLFDQLKPMFVLPREHQECVLSPTDPTENTFLCDIGTVSTQSSQALGKLWTRERYGAVILDAIHEDMTRTTVGDDGRSASWWQNTTMEDVRFDKDVTCKRPFWKRKEVPRGHFELKRTALFKKKIIRVNFACE